MRIYILLLLLCPLGIHAQEKIEADRPSETQSTAPLDKSRFQVETGVVKKALRSSDFTLQRPEVQLRYGLGQKLELRARATSETQKLKTENIYRRGLEPVEVGLKWNFLETKNEKFTASFLGHMGIPFLAASDHNPGKWYQRLRLLVENKITDKFKIGYNAGRDWDSEDQAQNWVFTISPQWEVGNHLLLYIEEFSFFAKNHLPEHNLRSGVEYFIGNNFEIDANGGVGLNNASPQYFFTAGFSFRL